MEWMAEPNRTWFTYCMVLKVQYTTRKRKAWYWLIGDPGGAPTTLTVAHCLVSCLTVAVQAHSSMSTMSQLIIALWWINTDATEAISIPSDYSAFVVMLTRESGSSWNVSVGCRRRSSTAYYRMLFPGHRQRTLPRWSRSNKRVQQFSLGQSLLSSLCLCPTLRAENAVIKLLTYRRYQWKVLSPR